MQFEGEIYGMSGDLVFDDVLGIIDATASIGRFVLNPGETLLLGHYVLAIGLARYAVTVYFWSGIGTAPQYYEFSVTNSLGLSN
jgi:hypothetical protein